MLSISYHLVHSIFEVLNTRRSKTLVTSDGKETGLLFSVHSGGFRDIKGFEHGLDFANRER